MYLAIEFSDSSEKFIPVSDGASFAVKDSTSAIIDSFAFGGVSAIELKEGTAPVTVPEPVVEPGTALVSEVQAGVDNPDKIVITTDPSTVEDLPVEGAVEFLPAEAVTTTDAPDVKPAVDVVPADALADPAKDAVIEPTDSVDVPADVQADAPFEVAPEAKKTGPTWNR